MASPLASCWTPVGRCASGPASSSETAVRVTHGLPTRRTTRHRAGVSNGGNSIPSVSAATRPPRRPQTRALRAFAVDRNEVLEDNESGLLPSSQRSFDKRSGKASGAVDAPLRSRDDSASSQKTVTRANASLADYCTLGVGGPARFLVEAYTTHQLVQTLRANAQEKINTVVIGKGSNVLFEDKGFDGCALVNKIEFVEEVFSDDALDDAIDDDATEAVSLLGVCSIGERHENIHPLHQNRRTNKSHAESDDAAAAAATATQKHENRRTDNKSRAETQNKSTSLESSLESNNNPQHKFIKVGSGTAFNHLGVAFSKRGWAGLEFAVGVPGTAGGAVFMNAGADGQDTASVLWQVEVVSPDGSEIRSLARGDLVGRFGYRTSPFMEDDTGRVFTEDQEEGKHFKATGVFGDAPEDANNFKQVASSNSPAYAGWIILSATFRLTKDSNAPSTAKACMRRRRTTQPLSERSVGCWFRNPGTGAESAGALIDKAGLKGLQVGNAAVSHKHANFLVYRDNASPMSKQSGDKKTGDTSKQSVTKKTAHETAASASDMCALITQVRAKVFATNGVLLEEEVRRVPFAGKLTSASSVDSVSKQSGTLDDYPFEKPVVPKPKSHPR